MSPGPTASTGKRAGKSDAHVKASGRNLAPVGVSIRKPLLSDVKAIQTLINAYASEDKMLPRSLQDMYELLRDFHVAEVKGKLAGVCALHITWDDLGEIRSLAVAKEFAGRGIGRTLVKTCLAEGRKLGMKRAFVLTYVPPFFEKLGFARVDKSELPHKVWADCIRCPQFPDCNEVSLVRNL